MSQPKTVFVSYSHKDESHKDRLITHLALMMRQGLIAPWDDRQIMPAEEWEPAIEKHLEAADLILLLITADFLASDYCYSKELERAMERHDAGQAKVLPIFVDHCDWKGAPFGKLQGVPKDAKPVTAYDSLAKAWTEVAKAIRTAIGETSVDAGPLKPSFTISSGKDGAQMVEQKRRVDAVAPSSARIAEPIDLLVQVRIPGSSYLGLKDWPLDHRPDSLVQDRRPATLLFPVDPNTGRIGSAKLLIRVVAPDFLVNGDSEKTLLVPSSDPSEIASFLLTPQRLGICRVNVEVLDIHRTHLGNIFISTQVGQAPGREEATASSLELKVSVSDPLHELGGHAHNSRAQFIIKDGKVIIGGNNAIRVDKMRQEKVISIGNGNTINAPLIIADQIEKIFNTIGESDIKGELKDLLSELINEVNKAAKTAPKDTAESMARDLESLSREVTSSKPRRNWFEISIEGLKEAAEAVGEVGKPILKTLAKVLRALSDVFA